MRSAVITFPGSNCDRDLRVAFEAAFDTPCLKVWHAETELPDDLDVIGLPGGFSYGDYLRCGAISARAPIMDAVVKAAEHGVSVIGICNGFQVLTEAGLLPGALIRNAGLKFVCRPEPLQVANADTRFTSGYAQDDDVTFPIAHHDGNYVIDSEGLERLEGEGRIAFRYRQNPNGSMNDIAGIINDAGNVIGMMPHPERAIDPVLGMRDGLALFRSLTA